MDNRKLEDLKTLHLIKKPVLWGMAAGLTLLTVYFLIVSVAESFSHSIEQFKERTV
jgi:hypothetical protein